MSAEPLPLPTFRDVYAGIIQQCPRARFPAVPSVPLGGHGPLRFDVALGPVAVRHSWSRELIDTRHVGDCCAPHIPDGSVGLYDPALPARDGDYVLVVMHDEFKRQWLQDVAGDLAMRRHYAGAQVPNVAVKQLRVIDGCAYACESLTAIPLANMGAVIGPLVRLGKP